MKKMETSEIKGIVEKYKIKLQPDNRLWLSGVDMKKISKPEQDKLIAFITPIKPQIIDFLMIEKEEEMKRIAEEERIEQIERENERNAIISGAKSISLDWDDGEYFQGFVVYGEEAKLLREIRMAKELGYRTIVPDDVVRSLGKSFTYTQAVEYMVPINEEKEKIKKKEEEAIQKKYHEAKETGKPVLLSKHSIECTDATEECSLDIINTWILPNGNTKTEVIHTY